MSKLVTPKQGDILKQLGVEPLLCPNCGSNAEPLSSEVWNESSPYVQPFTYGGNGVYSTSFSPTPLQSNITITWNCSRCSIEIQTTEVRGGPRSIQSSDPTALLNPLGYAASPPDVTITSNSGTFIPPSWVTTFDPIKVITTEPIPVPIPGPASCTSCKVKMPANECPASKSSCGHHSNLSWDTDVCEWCNERFDNL